MKLQHVLQAQDIAMLAAVHKKLGVILDAVNGKTTDAAPLPKKRGPKPGSKRKKKATAAAPAAVPEGKKYDPNVVTVAPETEPVPAS